MPILSYYVRLYVAHRGMVKLNAGAWAWISMDTDTHNSLNRLLNILHLFTEEQLEWTSTEIREALGYSRPTAYRYLKSLCDAGLLVSLPNASFTLGPKVVEMDYLLRRSDPLVLAADPIMSELAGTVPSTVLLVRWYRSKILCVHSISSMPHPLSSYPRGRPMNLGRGALARSILAFLPPRQAARLIEEHLDEHRAVGFGVSVEDVARNLQQIRSDGYAVAHGEVTPGVIGTAAPIFDSAKSPIASLCMTVSGTQADLAAPGEIANLVRSAAQRIGREIEPQRRKQSQMARLG